MTRAAGTLAVLSMAALSMATVAAPGVSVAHPADAEFPPEFAPHIFELVIKAVRDGDQRPVARTELLISGGNEAMGRWERRVTTDAQGMARVRLPMGEYAAYPLDAAFAGVWSGITLSKAEAFAVVPLQPACSIAGRVVDGEGKPLAGTRIETMVGMSMPRQTTGRRGEFRFERLPAGEHVLSAYAAGHSSADVRVAVRAGEHRRGLTVVLQRGATLTVTAMCGGDKCLGARVAVDGAGDGDYSEGDVDADGATSFRDLRVGATKVRAVKGKDLPGEFASPWVTHRLAAGDAAALTVTLTPTGGRGSIRGNVFTKSGKPLFASIEVDCAGVRRVMTTEKDGSFVVRDLPEGRRCKLIAARDGGRADADSDGRSPLRLVIDTPLNP